MGRGKRTKQQNRSIDNASSISLDSLDSSSSVPPSLNDTPPHPSSLDDNASQTDSQTATPVFDVNALVSLKQASFDALKSRVENTENQLNELPNTVALEVSKQLLNDVAPGAEKLAVLDEKLQEVDTLKQQLVTKEQRWDKKLEGLDTLTQYMGIAVATLITMTGVLGTGRANVSGLTKSLGYLLSGAMGLIAHETFNHLRASENGAGLSLFRTLFGKRDQEQPTSSQLSVPVNHRI